jgi:hypothetical protein
VSCADGWPPLHFTWWFVLTRAVHTGMPAAGEVSRGGLVGVSLSAPLRRISLCVALSSQLTVMASALPRRLIQFDYSLLFASYHDERDLGHL